MARPKRKAKPIGTIRPQDFNGSKPPPVISGKTRTHQSFKPEKAIVSELLIGTFDNNDKGTQQIGVSVPAADDLLLNQTFIGSYNLYPNAPPSGIFFRNGSYGSGISWPTINPGIDVSVGFNIEETALYKITPPDGYSQNDLKEVEVRARISILGPKLK